MASDDYDDRDESPGDIIRRAKDRVKVPAIGLIITGVISLLFIPYGIYNYTTLDKQFDQEIEKFDKQNPNATPKQKEDFNGFMNKFKDVMKMALPVVYGISTAVAFLTIYAGLQLRKLKSKGLVITASILSIIPFTSSCCFFGLIFGIWTFVSLSEAVVKKGFRLTAESASGFQDLDSDR